MSITEREVRELVSRVLTQCQGMVPQKAAPGSVIAARAHIHMTTADAARLGVEDGQAVRVQVDTPRPVTFEEVVVRVKDTFALAMHIDLDEANACALGTGGSGRIVRALP